MTGVQKTADALISLVRGHLLNEEPTGSLLVQVEEFCDDYDDVRKILIGEDKRSYRQQQDTLLEYARMYNFTREIILDEIKRNKEVMNIKYGEVIDGRFFVG